MFVLHSPSNTRQSQEEENVAVRLTKDKVSRVLLPLNHCTLEARKEARVEMKAKRHLEDIAPGAKKNPGEK